jgi:hypothetical protein
MTRIHLLGSKLRAELGGVCALICFTRASARFSVGIRPWWPILITDLFIVASSPVLGY